MNLRELIERGMKLRSELVWVIVGQLLGFVGSFIGIKVLTTVMGPKGYGELALGLTIAGLFNMYLYGPLANVVARFFAVYRERGELSIYFGVLKKAHTVLALLLCPLAGIVAIVVWPWFGAEWALIALVAILYGVVSGINSSYISLQSAMRQRQVVALHQGADVWLRTGLSILLLVVFQSSGSVALMGYLLGTFLITFSQALFARRSKEISSEWQQHIGDTLKKRLCQREFAGYAGSFMVYSGFAAISMYGDRWVIQGFFGSHEVGIYAAITQIASAPVNLFFAMINQLMVPIIFERAGAMSTAEQVKNSSNLLRTTVIVSLVVSMSITVLVYFCSRQLVELLTNGVFAEFHDLLWLQIFGLSIFNVGQVLSVKGLYCNVPRIYLLPKALQAALVLILSYLLARRFTMYGISAALCISSVIYVATIVLTNSKIKTYSD